MVAVLATLAMVATACSSGGDDDTAPVDSTPVDDTVDTKPVDTEPVDSTPVDDTVSTEPVDTEPLGELTASARGVTADTIKVGFSFIDYQELVDLSLTPSGNGDEELAMRSLVDALNADGGVNGRQLEVIYNKYSVLGTEGAEAVCLSLTQDNEVFAVLGGFVGPSEPANTCIVGRQGTVLVGGVQSEERLSEATAPWITSRPLRTRQAEILANLLSQEGDLEGRKIAEVASADSIDVLDSVSDALAAAGNEPVEKLTSEAAIGDIPAEDIVWGTLIERIRSSGADTVLLVGNPSAGIRNISQAGLDVDIWALDQESMLNLGSTVELEDARGVLAAVPVTGQAAWDSPEIKACRDAYTAANPDVQIIEPDDLVEGDENVAAGIANACSTLALFLAVAKPAGADLTNESFAAAAAKLSQFSLPAQPYNSLSADKFDANDSFALGTYNPEIGQNGGFDAITKITDVTP